MFQPRLLTRDEPSGGASHDFALHGFVLPNHPDAAAGMDPSAREEDKTMKGKIMASACRVRSGRCGGHQPALTTRQQPQLTEPGLWEVPLVSRSCPVTMNRYRWLSSRHVADLEVGGTAGSRRGGKRAA